MKNKCQKIENCRFCRKNDAPGADGEGWGWATVGWGQHRGWGGNIRGSTVGVSSTTKNRPPRHKYKSPKHFELKQSWKALRVLNAHGATCLSRFWGQKVKSVRRKIGQAKNRIKKTDRTNLIATNFVWEQLIMLLLWREFWSWHRLGISKWKL